MFYIYGDVVYMTRNADTIREFDYHELIFDVTFLSFYVFELHTIVWISNVVKQEAAQTGSMLFTTAVSADERLKQSVNDDFGFRIDSFSQTVWLKCFQIELFLLQVLNVQPEITVFGMFAIDNTLKFAVSVLKSEYSLIYWIDVYMYSFVEQIAGTITSFLTILIQFELADAQNEQIPRSMVDFKMFR